MKNKCGKTFSVIAYSVKTMFIMDRRYLFLLMASMIITSVIPFINANLLSEVINLATADCNTNRAVWAACIMLGILTILQSLDVYVMWYRSNHYISMGHKFDIMVAQKTLDMRYEKAENPEISELRMRAAKGCSAVPRIAESITDFGANIIKMISSVVIFTMFNPIILLIVVPFAALNYFVSDYFQKKYFENERMGYKPQRKINYFLSTMLDYVAGKDIRVFSATEFMKEKYCEQEKELYEIQKSTQKYALTDRIIGAGIVVIQLLILYLLVGREYFNGNVFIGDITLYINLVLVFSGAFSGLFGSFISAGWQGERLKDFREYMDIENENKLAEVEHIEPVLKTIEFQHVWFKYSGSDNYTLKDISLKIKCGKKFAIVGENGSGKTTLIKLLMRFYLPTKGRILVNGIDYQTINQDDYYKMFSTVFQDFNLMAFSIKENIDFSLGNTNNEEDIVRILKKLDMLEKIEKLPKGIDTHITQEYSPDGVNFSGGERQKLAIARADYKNAPILILDEPTSALDPIAEKKLYDELYHTMQDKTMIMISHRLQSTAICDYILFMKNGKIEEEGSHNKLMTLGGDYSKMFALQTNWYQEKRNK